MRACSWSFQRRPQKGVPYGYAKKDSCTDRFFRSIGQRSTLRVSVGQGCRSGGHYLFCGNIIVDQSGINKREVEEHKQRLDEFVAKNVDDVGANLRIRKVVDAGQAYVAIVDCAEKERIDLIVMSSHGRSGLSRMLIGSVTDKVLRGAPCPILVVPLEEEN